MESLIGKGRRPKFDLHLKIYDLNNVPLVSGSSTIKWHLAHSMHAEHRGRTSKCPIENHRVDYAFGKLVPSIRISIDRNNNLSECPLELEVLQEFAATEKITLGVVRVNLSEYIEESEILNKGSLTRTISRGRASSVAGVSPTSSSEKQSPETADHIEDGIVRRYLMQDSKVNSTLKISILMVQKDGDRNYIAPPLRTAPVFGGIAGIMAGDQVEDETGPMPSISKSRDAAEIQDLYRRTLAASWYRQPTELAADECVEDIFSGGNGWKTKNDSSGSPESDEEDTDAANHGTLRPSDFRRHHHHHHHSSTSSHQQQHHHHHSHHHHRRTQSGSSDKSASTVTGRGGNNNSSTGRRTAASAASRSGRDDGGGDSARDNDSSLGLGRSRGSSLASMTPTLGSDRSSRDTGLKYSREVYESDVRDDLVAWHLPGHGLAA